MSVDPDKLIESVNRDSAKRRITWLRDLANRLQRGEPTDVTDQNGLRELAVAFERGLENKNR